MKKISTAILAICLFSSFSFTQNRIGLDRIDAMVGTSTVGDFPKILMERTADTGVTDIKIWAWWGWINSEPNFQERPSKREGYWVVPGIRTSGWHRYRFEELDKAMNEAKAKGLSVALAVHGPPKWPRGDVCDYDLGTYHPCGIIRKDHYEIFKAAWFDFAFYLAQRYPEVQYFIAYNEPNLPYAFLPEKPYIGGSLLTAYMELAYWPFADGVRASGREVYIVGPEITLQDVNNEFGDLRWLENWILPILEHYPNHFDVIGVHSYTVDSHKTLERMEKLRELLKKFPHATQRVWLSEFNFGTEKESLTRTNANIFPQLLTLYSNQWWERSYFFTMLDNLVFADSQHFGEIRPLHHLFKELVRYYN